MNLQETVQALEQNNIQIALDVGVHRYCDINSNCPLAVELRKITNESGVTLAQLLEGFVTGQEAPPEPVSYELPEFDSKATIRIAGTNVELNLEDALRAQLGDALDKKRREFRGLGGRITALGDSLYHSYLNQVSELKRTKTLPQLEFPNRDVIRANCLITANNTHYIFLFPRGYSPEYIVTRGMRYKLADRDVKALKRDVYISYTITKERKILNAKILDDKGEGFRHYHGNTGEDCWGAVHIPERWDGSLGSLADFTAQLMGALHTLNKDSPISRQPNGMPHMDGLMERSTELGEEGHPEEREQPEGGWTTDTPRRWGQRRATRAPTTTEGEYMRRWDVPTDEEANELRNERAVCRLCGATYGEHSGWQCPGGRVTRAPTAEEDRMARWGATEYLTDYDLICALCGERFGNHYGNGGTICPREWEQGRRP